jgi:hypothetical protein
MELASLGLDIGIFCDFLYSVLLLNAIVGLGLLGLALSSSRRPGRSGTATGRRRTRPRPGQPRAAQAFPCTPLDIIFCS